MPCRRPRLARLALAAILASSAGPRALAEEPADQLLPALSAIAGSGPPDGVGAAWVPARPVSGRPGRSLSLAESFVGGTVPVGETGGESVYATASARGLAVRSDVLLPDDGVRLPAQFADIQAGGLFVSRLSGGRSWGFGGTVGSASDKPFHSPRELSATATAFYRLPSGERDAWLFYAVSSTAGQFARPIPIPGVAYQFERERWRGVVGFPFVSLAYTPDGPAAAEFYYAPLTDLRAQLLLGPADGPRLYGGFAWASQSYFRAGRPERREQTFLYEKRLESGVRWSLGPLFDLRLGGGYAFDRYFVENRGFSLGGHNRLDLGAGPFAGAQLAAHY